MNKSDSEVAAGALIEAGHSESSNPPKDGLIVINTCSVREHAVERLYGFINSLKPKSQSGRLPILAVGGCVAELKGRSLFDELPQADIVFGTRCFHLLPEAVLRIGSGEQRISLMDSHEHLPAHPPIRADDPARAWLPISRGCDNYCAYCVVPYARGRETSRPVGQVLEEARKMAARGVREITLLGQNVNSYGNDLGRAGMFAELLGSLDRIEGIERIRFMTSHPKDLSNATIEAIASGSNICESIHLPLQSGSDRILSAMNRKYDMRGYLDRIGEIREKIPNAAITTDIIVGFPGETKDDFQETMDALANVGFDAAFTFIYSLREGTAAADLPDPYPWDEKEARLRSLIDLQAKISLEANERYLGREVEVFVERTSRKGDDRWAGRTRTNKTVNFSASNDMKNRFVNVLIEEATPASLAGSLCGPTE